jgi:hypothetical protein
VVFPEPVTPISSTTMTNWYHNVWQSVHG